MEAAKLVCKHKIAILDKDLCLLACVRKRHSAANIDVMLRYGKAAVLVKGDRDGKLMKNDERKDNCIIDTSVETVRSYQRHLNKKYSKISKKAIKKQCCFCLKTSKIHHLKIWANSTKRVSQKSRKIAKNKYSEKSQKLAKIASKKIFLLPIFSGCVV